MYADIYEHYYWVKTYVSLCIHIIKVAYNQIFTEVSLSWMKLRYVEYGYNSDFMCHVINHLFFFVRTTLLRNR